MTRKVKRSSKFLIATLLNLKKYVIVLLYSNGSNKIRKYHIKLILFYVNIKPKEYVKLSIK